MTDSETDWRQIWHRLDQQRIKRGLSWRRVYADANVSQKKIAQMRNSGVPLESEAKRTTLSEAVGWRHDGITRLTQGLEPIELGEPEQPVPRRTTRPGGLAALEVAVAQLRQDLDLLLELSQDRVAKFDELLAVGLPELAARVAALEDRGFGRASGGGH